MYSLDINFLNDRPEYKPDAASARAKPRAAAPSNSRQPLIMGGVAFLLLSAIPLGLWLFLQSRNADLEQQGIELDAQIGDLQSRQKQLASINAEVTQVKNETGALATVFNQIKPWSALMQDIRARVPRGIQITEVKQLPLSQAPAPPPPPPAAGQPGSPPPPAVVPTGPIQISGVAGSFSDVNDFLLTLKNSPFLNPAETRIATSESKPGAPLAPLNIPGGQGAADLGTTEIPPVVNFQIQTTLSPTPASELLRDLELKGATGLVTRIEALKKKGVIQQ